MVDNRRVPRGYAGGALPSCNTNYSSNRNSNCNSNCNSNSRTPQRESCDVKALKKKLQMIDFAIVETVLYLDAYPDSKAALEYYKKLVSERQMICDALAQGGHPVTHRDNVSMNHWDWADGPWPWQHDAN